MSVHYRVFVVSLLNSVMALPLFVSSLSPLLADEIDESYTESFFSLSTSVDNGGNSDKSLFLNLSPTSDQQIQLAYGVSSSTEDSATTKQLAIGVSTDPYKIFSIGSELSYWGAPSLLESKTFKTQLNFNGDNWGITLAPQLGVITVFHDVVLGMTQFDVQAIGNETRISYYGFDDYSFTAGYFVNRFGQTPYDNANRRLRTEVLDRISTITRQLANSLESNRTQLSAARFFNWGSVGVDWYRSHFALISGSSTSMIFTIDYSINQHFSLSMGYGQQTASEDNFTADFINSSISIIW